MGRNRVSRRCGRAWQNIACAFESADEAEQGGRTICWSSSDRAPETAAAHSEAGVPRVGVVLEADARVARAQLVVALPPLLYLAHRRRLLLAHQVGQQPDRRVVAQLPRLALAHAPRHRAAYVVGVVAQRAWRVRRSEMATWAASGWKATASRWYLRRWVSPAECEGGRPTAFRCRLTSPWWPAMASPRRRL